MASVSKSTRDALAREFIEVTGSSAAEATRYLKSTTWRLDAAIDAFFSNATLSSRAPANTVSVRNLEQLWKQYADSSNPEEMAIDGTLSYCQDLKVEPEDPVMLAVACITKAPSMGRFAKQGWIDAWKEARQDTITGQQSHIQVLRDSMKQPDFFRRVYNFTFDYAKNEGQKSLQHETACDLWSLLIPLDPGSHFPEEHLQWWQQFLADKGSRAVSRDTWNLFLEFVRTIDDRFEQYDEEAAWPSLIDDFVQRAREKVRQS
ncbi:hypothetical protein ACM66B_006886 [Microbotryomycetes sp. NB124-2]